MNFKIILTLLYFLVLAFEMYLRAYNYAEIEVFVKPLLMPILLIYLKSSGVIWNKVIYLLAAALFFSWIGDILLLTKINIFIGGLGSFLIAHICYIYCFRKNFSGSLLKKNPLYAIPFFVLGTGMLLLIKGNLGELLIPVIVYTSVIILMGLFAINRKDFVNNPSFNWVLIGAILFIISDSLIALTRFYTPIPLDGVWIMLFYGTGQYLITEGIIKELPVSYIE